MKGLYVHIPFCLKKCKYCDFNSFPFCGNEKSNYLGALFSEIENYRNERLDTVFIGGGTPTALESTELLMLLTKINETFDLSDNCEFTIEANPKTLDTEKLSILKQNGVNRISIGVQSFNDNELKLIGRIHTADEAAETVRLAKNAGFSNISIDLMSALPSQTLESFKKTMSRAVELDTSHISCYSLILEEGTPLFEEFNQGKLRLPDEDTEREMYEYACSFLQQNGYEQYEISNFAKHGCESRHNIKYWQCDEYIGVGLSAHSYLAGKRFSNTDDFSRYITGKFNSNEINELSIADKMSEFMFLGLRMNKGVSKAEFKKRFGKELHKVFKKPISKFKKMGLIIEENGFYHLSHDAISVSNSIMCEFIL